MNAKVSEAARLFGRSARAPHVYAARLNGVTGTGYARVGKVTITPVVRINEVSRMVRELNEHLASLDVVGK